MILTFAQMPKQIVIQLNFSELVISNKIDNDIFNNS